MATGKIREQESEAISLLHQANDGAYGHALMVLLGARRDQALAKMRTCPPEQLLATREVWNVYDRLITTIQRGPQGLVEGPNS